MCLVRYRPTLGRKQGALPFETFVRLVDSLPDLEEVTLQGLGEPLLAPDLLAMVEHVKRRGARVGFNSNATLLTRPLARRLVELELDWLHVSLDGASAATYEAIRDGASFSRVRANLESLLEERRAAGAALPRVLLVFVAMRRNVHELSGLVRVAGELGADGVYVQNLSHSFSDTDPAGAYAEIRAFAEEEALWNGHADEARAAFADAEALAGRLGVELRLPRVEAPAPRADGEPGCAWPWTSAYVDHRGRVQPCCMVMGAERATLGAVADDGLATAWHGEPYREFRGRLRTDDPPDVCRGCSLYRRVF
jgi:radical SAM protein with 4Fe4S-binding SPASM domain